MTPLGQYDAPLVSLHQVTAGYRSKEVLHDIELEIRAQCHLVILGPRASGKSTLLATIAGRTLVSGGQITYHPASGPVCLMPPTGLIAWVSMTNDRLLRHTLAAHYYQQRYQAFDSSGHTKVCEVLDGLATLSDAESNTRQSLYLLNIGPLWHLELIKLSSGQMRRVILARALLSRARLILIDDPHSGLDTLGRAQFNALLDDIAALGETTFVLAGQMRSLPACIAQTWQMADGRLQATNQAGDPLAQQANLVHHPVLSQIADRFSQTPDLYGEVLSVRDLRVKYGDRVVFDRFNWTVNRGDKWALTGSNGSGKSTLLSVLYADHPQAYANDVSVFGRRRGTGDNIWDIKKHIGFVSTELLQYFPPNMTVNEVLASGLTDTFVPGRQAHHAAKLDDLLLQYFHLCAFEQHPLGALSAGTKRLLLFIRALMKAPAVLLLDEPYQDLDEQTVQQCNDLLCQVLSPKHTLIFISHYTDEVPTLCTRHLNLDLLLPGHSFA